MISRCDFYVLATAAYPHRRLLCPSLFLVDFKDLVAIIINCSVVLLSKMKTGIIRPNQFCLRVLVIPTAKSLYKNTNPVRLNFAIQKHFQEILGQENHYSEMLTPLCGYSLACLGLNNLSVTYYLIEKKTFINQNYLKCCCNITAVNIEKTHETHKQHATIQGFNRRSI